MNTERYEQNEWEAGPDQDLAIPAEYITGLKYEIVVFGEKKSFTFRCNSFEFANNRWTFENVIIDTSKLDPKGEVELKRITYHPEVSLVNVGFMVIPAPENPELSISEQPDG